jgi:hypothetical protein
MDQIQIKNKKEKEVAPKINLEEIKEKKLKSLIKIKIIAENK